MLGGVPQGAAASTIAAPSQQHLKGNTLLGPGPAAGIKENLSLQWQLLILYNKKNVPPSGLPGCRVQWQHMLPRESGEGPLEQLQGLALSCTSVMTRTLRPETGLFSC